MASKIEKEVSNACDISPKDHDGRQAYLAALMKATAKLSEKGWDELSADAQDWYNKNADKRNEAKKAERDAPPVTDFADAEEEEAPTRRRRDDDDAPRRGADEKPSVEKLKEGDRVKITNKRGKVFEGTVVENNPKKEFVAVKGADGEDEIDYDRVDSLEVFHGDAGKGKKDKEEPSDPIRVGAKVKVITKRGKEFVGVIKELTKDDLVLTTSEGEEDLARDRIDTITPAGGSSDDEGRRRSSSSSDDSSKKKEEEAPTTRASGKDGKSVGTYIKEYVADDFAITQEEVMKKLKKDGIDAKENTVKLNLVDCLKFIDVLKAKGLLKTK